MQRLFDRCPTIPVDSSLSLARYCMTLKQTLLQAEQYMSAGDAERSALLHIRCVQVANRTLPAHPEYSLPQNEQWLKELRRITGKCLISLEHLKGQIEVSPKIDSMDVSVAKQSRVSQNRPLEIEEGVLQVLERMSSETTQSGAQSIGLLAGKLEEIGQDASKLRVAALVVPHQRGSKDNCEMLDEMNILGLQEAKGLFVLGWLVVNVDGSKEPSPTELRSHAGFQAMMPECVVGIVDPNEPTQCKFFGLTELGLSFILRYSDRIGETNMSSHIPDGYPGAGSPLYKEAQHVQKIQARETTPSFKVCKFCS
ncbi:hypothetical protein NDN08_001868 [Rhodosorus marinus]|uniref:MPN domain-containing protein n=1 Tax=Rhodosorus marinus TaxID=101924 RepID=A0AAV8US41_9RHOD|nr:hypothetical protein NDN08_001868 [Rhodosorus marinus]